MSKSGWRVAGFHMNPPSTIAIIKKYDDNANLLEEREVDVLALESSLAAARKVIEAADALRGSTGNWGGPHICDNFPSQFENGLRKREAAYDLARREWEGKIK